VSPADPGRAHDRGEVEAKGTLGGSFAVTPTDRDGQGRGGRVFDLVEVRGQTLIAAPVRDNGPLPTVGTTIRCRSSAGIWEAQVQRIDGDRLHLTLPAWTARPTPRRSVRVPMDLVAIEVVLAGRTSAARLLDLSIGGAAVVVERLTASGPGTRPTIVLPRGRVQAMVVGRRPHDHPLLVILGVSFEQRDDDAKRWIADQVSARRFG
jgi:hypothetical protein